MKKILITISLIAFFFSSKGQTSVAFQHLGNTTFQHNMINPALIPEGKIFFGLPVMSGIHVNVNTKTSYNQTFTKEANRTLVDVDKIVSELQNQNLFSAKVNVNILHFGYRLKSGPLLSLVVNERVEGDFLYPEEMVRYVFTDGNFGFLNEDVRVSRAGLLASHFREFGLGIAAPINERMNLGLRAKYLVGFTNVSVPGNAQATLRSSGEAFQLNADWQNIQFRTSGLNILQQENGFESSDLASHLVMNGNTGVALDIGGTYRLNSNYTVTGSIVDIGFINWNEDIENEIIADTSFVYTGLADFDDVGNIRTTLEDSLFDKFDTDKNFEAYRSWLPTTAYANWIYHYGPNTDIYATVGSRYIQRQFKMMYGLGVNQKFGRAFTASLSATKLPQQFLNMGAAFAVQGGPVQMYMAVDHIINFSVPDAKAIDFRFGMNFILKGGATGQSGAGGSPVSRLGDGRGLDTNAFLGKKVKTRKREGIYSIIKKQHKRELKNPKTKRNSGVRKKSLTGRRGKKNN